MKIKILLLILFYVSILEAQTFEGRLMYTFIIDNGTQIPEQGISDYFLNMQQGQIEYFIKEDTLLGVVTNRKGDFLYIEKQIGKNMSMINEFGKEVDLNGVANSLDFELEKRTKESTEMLGLTAHKVILNDKHIYFEKPTKAIVWATSSFNFTKQYELSKFFHKIMQDGQFVVERKHIWRDTLRHWKLQRIEFYKFEDDWYNKMMEKYLWN